MVKWLKMSWWIIKGVREIQKSLSFYHYIIFIMINFWVR